MNRETRKKLIQVCLLAMVVTAVFCAPAGGGDEDGYHAPTIESNIPWGALGVMVICVGGIVFLALKNPGRSHQSKR